MNHCCEKMEGVLKEEGTPISYVPYTRSYDMAYARPAFYDQQEGDRHMVVEPLVYCPWCGVALPDELFDLWIQEIKEKFNVVDTLDPDELEKIPEEYLTQEWWQKRGI